MAAKDKLKSPYRIAGLLVIAIGSFFLFYPHGLFAAYQRVSFETADQAVIHGNLYGEGEHAVLLLHGGVFTKESWHQQALAMAKAGLSVLAIDFRGRGKSTIGEEGYVLKLDVLGAIKYLKSTGKKRISLVGGSMGGRNRDRRNHFDIAWCG
ncbi:MAG: alpha/beta hydrolase family protein [Limisphaerales bacterium]